MALERVPSDIRAIGGVARMSDPYFIKEIMDGVSIPVMAKCRIGHFAEAEILELLEVDYIDESEVLTPLDWQHHIEKHNFSVPFVCGARNLGELLRRINEGAAMLRTKGEAGTGDISELVTHIRLIQEEIEKVLEMKEEDIGGYAEELRVPITLVENLRSGGGKLPVVNFAAGGVATPADAALCMKLGCDGVFVGSGIFKSENPEKVAELIVKTVANYENSKKVLEYSSNLGKLMGGVAVMSLGEGERYLGR